MGLFSINLKALFFTTLILFLPWSSWAGDIGFSGGDTLEATPIEGLLEISCWENGQRDFKYTRCENVLLLPYEFDYLVTKREIDADRVILKAHHQDGSSEKKKGKYLPKKKRSRSHFNLWINTLLQDPLLEFGQNKIEYKFTKKGKSVETGSFDVNVIKGQDRVCPRARYDSHRLDDCRNEYRACAEYYEYFDFCAN